MVERIYLPNIQRAAEIIEPAAIPEMPFGLGCGFPVQTTDSLHADVATVGPMCWKNWGYNEIGKAADTEKTPYLPMVYGDYGQREDAVLAAMSENKDRLWLAMNEPHGGDQANMTPAQAHKQMSAMLRTGATVSNPSVMVAPGYEFGLCWLDEYIRISGMVPPIWNIHMYGMTSEDAVFELWEVWTEWQKERDHFGNADIPVIVSEFNGTPGTIADQMEVMDAFVQLIDADEIRAAMWFASRYRNPSDTAWLLTPDGDLSEVGERFRATVSIMRKATASIDTAF